MRAPRAVGHANVNSVAAFAVAAFAVAALLLAPLAAAAQTGAPAVTGVSISSSPAGGSSYATGENIDVAVVFSRAVTVTGSPRLALTVGSRTRQAAFRSASGSTVNFRYTTIGGDRDSDGVSIAADALTLNGGGIKAGSVDAALGLGSHALGDQSAHRVDGGGPTFNGVASPALSFTRGARGSFTLPAAGSATRYTTYALAATPALAGGLTFNFGTRTLSGTPEVGMAKTTYTLNAYRLVPYPGEEGVFYEELADTLAFTVAVSGAVPAVSGGGDRLQPGGRLQLRHRRVHRGARDVQLPGGGDGRAAAGARHRRRHAAGGTHSERPR